MKGKNKNQHRRENCLILSSRAANTFVCCSYSRIWMLFSEFILIFHEMKMMTEQKNIFPKLNESVENPFFFSFSLILCHSLSLSESSTIVEKLKCNHHGRCNLIKVSDCWMRKNVSIFHEIGTKRLYMHDMDPIFFPFSSNHNQI